mgnify:CR=1 FL=1
MEEKTREDMITMVTDSGESVDFYVLEETRINARSYLLVTDAPEGEDGECYILKDMSGQQDAEAVYEFVEDENSTLEHVSGQLRRTENKMQNVFKLQLAGFRQDF